MQKDNDTLIFLEKNLGVRQITCSKYQPVINGTSGSHDIWYVKSGTAGLCVITPNGDHRILTYYETGDFFDAALLHQLDFLETAYLLALTKCSFFVYHEKNLSSARMNAELMRVRRKIAVSYEQKVSLHLAILMQTSLRSKLLSYFSHRQDEAGTVSFLLPFSYSRLAEYLAVDRSSMMRELSAMKKNGLIETDGKRITLL